MSELEKAAKEYAQKYKSQVSAEGLENIADDFIYGAKWMRNKLFPNADEIMAEANAIEVSGGINNTRLYREGLINGVEWVINKLSRGI